MRNGRITVPICAFWMVACGGQGEPLLATTPGIVEDEIEFAIDLWPGEGIPVIQMQRTALPVFVKPDPSAAVVDTLRGRIGQRVAFDSTRYQTIKIGAFRVVDAVQVKGRDLGVVKHLTLDRYYQSNLPDVSVHVGAESAIDFLQYRAEGTCFVRVDGRVIDAQPCPGFGPESVQVVREPVTRWWIGVRGTSGGFGWLLVSDSTARPVRREF